MMATVIVGVVIGVLGARDLELKRVIGRVGACRELVGIFDCRFRCTFRAERVNISKLREIVGK